MYIGQIEIFRKPKVKIGIVQIFSVSLGYIHVDNMPHSPIV